MRNLLILGAGGHGKVVADAALLSGMWEKIAFLDDRITLNQVMGLEVLGPFSHAAYHQKEFQDLAVAVGDNARRLELIKEMLALGFNLPPIIHPTAAISPLAEIGAGSVIFAQTAINCGTRIGLGCIINTGATVDHDCILSEGVHLSPGVHLAGEVQVGQGSWIGIGSSVIQQVKIGQHVIIGAGAAIIHSIEDKVTVVGVPGRVIKRNGV